MASHFPKPAFRLRKLYLNLGGDPADPFKVFPEVSEYWVKILNSKRSDAMARKKSRDEWASANPELSDTLDKYLSGTAPGIDYAQIPCKPNAATRNTSGDALAYFSAHVGNMIVMSADLSNQR